jgi:hypothetical protein
MEARRPSRRPGVTKRDYGVLDYATMLKKMPTSVFRRTGSFIL